MARIKEKSKARLLSDKTKNSKRKVAELTNANEAEVTFSPDCSFNSLPPSFASIQTKHLKISLCRDVRGCSNCRQKHDLPADPLVIPSTPCTPISLMKRKAETKKAKELSNLGPEANNNVENSADVAGSSNDETAGASASCEMEESDADEMVLWDIDTTDIDATLLLTEENHDGDRSAIDVHGVQEASLLRKSRRETRSSGGKDPGESFTKSSVKDSTVESNKSAAEIPSTLVGEANGKRPTTKGAPPSDSLKGAVLIDDADPLYSGAQSITTKTGTETVDSLKTNATSSSPMEVATDEPAPDFFQAPSKASESSRSKSRKRAPKKQSAPNMSSNVAKNILPKKVETKSSQKYLKGKQNSSTRPHNLQLALSSKSTKLWKCGDCSFRTNMRNALLDHRRQKHTSQQQSSFKTLRQQASASTESSEKEGSKNTSGQERKRKYKGKGDPLTAECVKYQCHECLTSSTQLTKILQFKGHEPGHRILLHCPHCEYLIDYTTSALTRMKNHCLNSHIKMRCRRCFIHIFKGYQAASVLEHLQSHLTEDAAWIRERTKTDAQGTPIGWLTGREKCPHCHRNITAKSSENHFREHIVHDWREVQDYFRSCLEAIGLNLSKDSGAGRRSSSEDAPDEKMAGYVPAHSSSRVPRVSGKENTIGGVPPLPCLAGHGNKSPRMDKWSCDHCAFETDSPEAYMKHLVDSHNPSSLPTQARRKAQPATELTAANKRKRKEFEGHKKKTAYREERRSAPIVEISIEDDDLINSVTVPPDNDGFPNAETVTIKEPEMEQHATSSTDNSGATFSGPTSFGTTISSATASGATISGATNGVTISDTNSSGITISGANTSGTNLSGDSTSSATISDTIISNTIASAMNASTNESVERKSPEEMPEIAEEESSKPPESQMNATITSDFCDEQGSAKTVHEQSQAKSGEEEEGLSNVSICNDTEMTDPVIPDRTDCDQDDQREAINSDESSRSNIDAASDGVHNDRPICNVGSKKGETCSSHGEIESVEGIREKRSESEDVVSIQSTKENYNIGDSDNPLVSIDEASLPNIDAASEDVEIDRPISDADLEKGETSSPNCNMEYNGEKDGMSTGPLESEDRLSTQSTKYYSDIDDSDIDVINRPVSSKDAVSSSFKSAQSSPVKFEKSVVSNPCHKFRARFEKLEKMSPIEVLGFFRRFVTALIIYKGTSASPLIDWEDAALRPIFYPAWLPWLDPDAKPDGFEDCVWTALLKEGLKYMFREANLCLT